MTNKGLLLALIITMLIAGTAFAQEEPAEAQAETEMPAEDETTAETDQPKIKKPKNTITVDFGPLITAAIGSEMIGSLQDLMGSSDEGAPDSSTSRFGFGIGAFYERQITDRVSAGGRFSFMTVNAETKMEIGDGVTAAGDFGFNSFSIEGHARFYPWAKTFFLDGMLGFAFLSVGASATLVSTNPPERESIDIKLERGYFKLGGRLGWRIDFGKPGGFVLEPSLGLAGGIGFGDSILKQLGKEASAVLKEPIEIDEAIDGLFTWLVEPLLIDAVPNFALTFGWRF